MSADTQLRIEADLLIHDRGAPQRVGSPVLGGACLWVGQTAGDGPDANERRCIQRVPVFMSGLWARHVHLTGLAGVDNVTHVWKCTRLEKHPPSEGGKPC